MKMKKVTAAQAGRRRAIRKLRNDKKRYGFLFFSRKSYRFYVFIALVFFLFSPGQSRGFAEGRFDSGLSRSVIAVLAVPAAKAA